MTNLIDVQIRGLFAPSTYEESLERFTCDGFRSLTITGIVKVAFYYLGIVLVMGLDKITGRRPPSLTQLIANRTVYQLNAAKDALVRNLPEFLQKNWKTLAINTVILSGAALVVYLREPFT